MNHRTDNTSRAASLTLIPLLWAWAIYCGGLRPVMVFLFFQSNPRAATILNAGIVLMFWCLFFYCWIVEGPKPFGRTWPKVSKWILLFLAWSGTTLLWTQAPSRAIAIGYWVVFLAETLLFFGFVRYVESRLLGDVWIRAWTSSTWILLAVSLFAGRTDDVRLGDFDYLHPNPTGNQFAMAALFGSYLFLRQPGRNRAWWLLSTLSFVLMLFRTISKTSIIAFVAAMLVAVIMGKGPSAKSKAVVVVFVLMALLLSWPLLETYAQQVADSPDILLTLTGRTVFWKELLEVGSERPLWGYGFYSFKAIGRDTWDFAVTAHNEWLNLWLTLGVVGVFLGIHIYVSFFQQIKKFIRTPTGRIAFALLLYSLIRGTTEANLNDLIFPFGFILVLSKWVTAHCAAVPTHSALNGLVSASGRPSNRFREPDGAT